jgi:hypothetical protein
MKRTIGMVSLIWAVGVSSAFAFPVGKYVGMMNHRVIIKQVSGHTYHIDAEASSARGPCVFECDLIEKAPNFLSGKLHGKPVKVKFSKDVIQLTVDDIYFCGNSGPLSGEYKKQ